MRRMQFFLIQSNDKNTMSGSPNKKGRVPGTSNLKLLGRPKLPILKQRSPTADRFPQKLVRAIRERTSRWLPGDWIVVSVLSVFGVVMWFNYSSETPPVTAPVVASKPYVADPPLQTPQYVRPN